MSTPDLAVPPADVPTADVLPADGPRADASERVRALYEEHAPALLRYARRRSPQFADDIVSETFAVAVRRADEIPIGRELPWLYVVADLTFRNMVRSQRRAGRLIDALAPLTPVSAAGPTELPVVGDALGTLPDRERAMLTMTAFEGLSATEAADRMGIPYGSARNALVSGRRRLAVSLAALGVAMLLVLIVRPLLSGAPDSRRAPSLLKASIARAGAIHDVALVRRAGAIGAGGGTRYERWSDPSGDRQRVVLPGGHAVTAKAGETLGEAAARIASSRRGRSLSPSAQQDLVALDAASPSVIAALAADPAARAPGVPGPRINGRDTTVLRGRVTDSAKVEHAVEATIATDAPDVLRVRAQRLQSGARVGEVSVVDFVQWTPLAPGPATDASLGGPAANGGPVQGSDAAVPRSAGVPATTPRRMAGTKQHPGTPERPASAVDGRESPEANLRHRLASAPIFHLNQTVEQCSYVNGTASSCINFGNADVWLELGGAARTHMVRRPVAGAPVKSEEWRVGTERSYFRFNKTGGAHGMQEQFEPDQYQGSLPGWQGTWLKQLAPQLQRLHDDPAAVAALPAGTEVGGRPTRLATGSVVDGPVPASYNQQDAGPWTVDIKLDPATRWPLELFVHRSGIGDPATRSDAYEAVRLGVGAVEQVPAGNHASLLRGHFPPSAQISRPD